MPCCMPEPLFHFKTNLFILKKNHLYTKRCAIKNYFKMWRKCLRLPTGCRKGSVLSSLFVLYVIFKINLEESVDIFQVDKVVVS